MADDGLVKMFFNYPQHGFMILFIDLRAFMIYGCKVGDKK